MEYPNVILPAEGGSVARYEPHSFPPELIELRRWIVWRDEEGRKVPYVADRGLMQCASPTNANDWRTYAEAVAAYEANPSRWSTRSVQ